ncbi:malonyl-CoA decarboxylase domain-containing protein [Dermatobacter hominis]|uniref:malonyl-CoA decarboxylase domain-containing protein n=1 Tax=Dermatobacter hominis TaxID=2884263 RepID=UPI001D125593|nr:malonyl-CoA decarboxylase family protein [Dermatobacter hominis]UDY35895.1 malonyl-CoA decarboxylase family protein [Dermatobacter hominis]
MTTPPSADRLVARRATERAELVALLRREPVNPVDGAEDPEVFDRALADRTDVDRRVFVLVHPHHPEHPRTVVWVALTVGVPGSLVELLDDRPATDPAEADTAVFWSIWNADREVPGVGTGVDLILGAAEQLREELPHLATFVTLSPVPGLRRWLEERAGAGEAPVDPSDRSALCAAAARYLTARRPDGRPLDPVARFHLRNGARLWRLDPDADPSERGRQRSHGLMVNYRYEPEDRAANRELLERGDVALGDDVRALLEG